MGFFSRFKACFFRLFKELPAYERAAQASLTVAAPIIVGILAAVDPAAVPVVAPILETVRMDLATAATLLEVGQATPTLKGLLEDVRTNLSQILALAAVKNSAKVAFITADVNEVVLDLEEVLAHFPV